MATLLLRGVCSDVRSRLPVSKDDHHCCCYCLVCFVYFVQLCYLENTYVSSLPLAETVKKKNQRKTNKFQRFLWKYNGFTLKTTSLSTCKTNMFDKLHTIPPHPTLTVHKARFSVCLFNRWCIALFVSLAMPHSIESCFDRFLFPLFNFLLCYTSYSNTTRINV